MGTMSTATPAGPVKQLGKLWGDVRKQQQSELKARQKQELELQQLGSELSDVPDPHEIAKGQLKKLKKVVDTERKINEQRVVDDFGRRVEVWAHRKKKEYEREKQLADDFHQQELELEDALESALEKIAVAAPVIPEEKPAPSTVAGTPEIAAAPELPPSTAPVLTGPSAIMAALQALDLDGIEAESKATLKAGLKTKRPLAVERLNFVQGLRRNQMRPEDLMITKVPVLPPTYRPYSLGDSLIVGDVNLLYKDLLETRGAYQDTAKTFGEQNAGQSRLALYDAVKAVFGFGESTNPKLREKNVSGTLQKILGSSPKYGVVQRRLLSKPQDNVGRSTVIPDPDLSIDQIGIPEEMAWKIYAPFIQRRLTKGGLKPADALRYVKDRAHEARRALEQEMADRPVIYSRAPSWHKFNTLAAFPVIREDNAIGISPLVTTGQNMDFDGDQANVHVPAFEETVREAKEKLLGSKMLWQVRDPDKVMPTLKHEIVLGLYAAKHKPSGKRFQFATREEALRAIKRGDISLNDDVEILGG